MSRQQRGSPTRKQELVTKAMELGRQKAHAEMRRRSTPQRVSRRGMKSPLNFAAPGDHEIPERRAICRGHGAAHGKGRRANGEARRLVEKNLRSDLEVRIKEIIPPKPITRNGALAHLPLSALASHSTTALGDMVLGISASQERWRQVDKATLSGHPAAGTRQVR